jgi:hypothetical protein
MNTETKCPGINCNRHLGYNMEKSDSIVYCKGCRNYTHFKKDGSKKMYLPEFLPSKLKKSFQDNLQSNLQKK